MSTVVASVNQIETQTLTYVPAVIAGVQAAQLSTAAGNTKKAAVMDAILAGAKVGEAMPVPQVAAVSGLIDMVVSIFNALGIFKHSAKPAA